MRRRKFVLAFRYVEKIGRHFTIVRRLVFVRHLGDSWKSKRPARHLDALHQVIPDRSLTKKLISRIP